MGEANRYVDMSAVEAMKLAKNHFLLLPDIQREYVWDIKDIEKLFESIVDGYPIGSCIFWKTNKKTLNDQNPNLYFFMNKFEKYKSKNEKAPEVFSEEGDYYVVLDGQQRITSINIALNGSYTYYKGGRGKSMSNPKYWVKKELYYNLDFYKHNIDGEKDDEHPPKRFCFLSEGDEVKSGNYYKVNQLLKYDDNRELLRDLIKYEYDEKIQDDLERLYSRLNNSGNDGLIHYYCISENSYDEALDIFIRVNSTGRKLSKSDLLFSTLIDGWKTGKEGIEQLLQLINSKGDGFNFSRDYLMRLMLVLSDAPTNLKIDSFKQSTIKEIRNNFEKISTAVEDMVDLLVSLGLSNSFINSYNATMPIAYYLYKGGNFKSEESKKEARKFLSISMAKRLFGIASNDALRKTRNALKMIDCKKNHFSLKMFKDISLTGNRNFVVSGYDIEYWLDNYVIGQSSFIILSLLYPDLKLNQVSFHQDHCHPHAAFNTNLLKELGISNEKIHEWQSKRNLIPNLQFLEGRENEVKNKTPLKDWIERGNTIKFMPENVSLELKDFDQFFEERRKIIKNKLCEIFEI